MFQNSLRLQQQFFVNLAKNGTNAEYNVAPLASLALPRKKRVIDYGKASVGGNSYHFFFLWQNAKRYKSGNCTWQIAIVSFCKRYETVLFFINTMLVTINAVRARNKTVFDATES